MHQFYHSKKKFALKSNKLNIFNRDNVNITIAIAKEIENQHFVILVTSNSKLLIYLDQNDFPPLTKSVLIDDKRGPIKAICFDNTSSLIYAQDDGSIFKIPVALLMKHPLKVDLSHCDGSIVSLCLFPHPTSLVFWQSVDAKLNLIILGNNTGHLIFIDACTNQSLGEAHVADSIQKLVIVHDKFSTSLLISSSNHQLRLILEKYREKNTNTSGNLAEDDIRNYFGWFIDRVENDNHYPMPNFKPSTIDISIYEKERNEIIYRIPYIINLVMFSDGCSGQIRVYNDREFNYSTSSHICHSLKDISILVDAAVSERLIICCDNRSCYILSREPVKDQDCLIQKYTFTENIVLIYLLPKLKENDILDPFLVITSFGIYSLYASKTVERYFIEKLCFSTEGVHQSLKTTSLLKVDFNKIIEKCGDEKLKRGLIDDAMEFYRIAKISYSKRVFNLLFIGKIDRAIKYIKFLLLSESHKISLSEKIHLSNIVINCWMKQILDKYQNVQELPESKHLKTFFESNNWYDADLAIKNLVRFSLFDFAHLVALTRYNFSTLLAELLLYESTRNSELKKCIGESTDYCMFLEDSLYSSGYLRCLTSNKMIQALLIKPELTGRYIRVLIKLLPRLDTELLSTAKTFDPRSPTTQLLINYVLPQWNQFVDDNFNEESAQKKDVLNFFIHLLLIIFRQKKSSYVFDERLLNFSSVNKPCFTNNYESKTKTKYSLAAGYNHACLIKYNLLYKWGRCNYVDVTSPTLISYFPKKLGISVREVSCGASHTLVCTDIGVFSFGSSQYGQLGFGKEVKITKNPILIEDLIDKDIIQISAGQYHSLAVSSKGELYTWGWGIHGQLGLGVIENVYFPTRVETLKHRKIVSAVGGHSHSLALDKDGIIYSWGSGLFGQLGINGIKKCITPQQVILDAKIKMISSTYFHSLALSSDYKKIYTWGYHPFHLRFESCKMKKRRFTKDIVEASTIVSIDLGNIKGETIKIATGGAHSALLTDNGELYTWGLGAMGQLGHGTRKNHDTPTIIVKLNHLKLVDIALGYDFTLAIDSNGELWGFGQSSNGILTIVSSENDINDNLSKESKSPIKKKKAKCFRTIELTPVKIHHQYEDFYFRRSFNVMYQSNDKYLKLKKYKNYGRYDQEVLASIIFENRQDIHLDSILTSCLSYDNHQIAGVIHEIKGALRSSMEEHLRALSDIMLLNYTVNCEDLSKKIFGSYIDKLLNNTNDSIKAIETYLEFGQNAGLDLENNLLECYDKKMSSFLFGVLFFQHLCDKKYSFSKNFLLKMVSITMERMNHSKLEDFTSITIMNLMASGDGHFPTEVMWQKILQNVSKTNSHELKMKNDD